jgi:serine/threonine-protein kinase/endoribonuclease IRE1
MLNSYIGMEFCRATLDQLIKGQYEGPSVGTDKDVLKQIARAVDYLTGRGLVNRKINPHNILISHPDGMDPPRIKLVDFSVSRKSESGELENSGSIVQNEWTAPELLRNERTYTAAVDVFSTGCVLSYFLSRGRHPFGEPINQVINIISGKIVMLPETSDFAAIDLIQKMLKTNPAERITIKQVLAHPYFWDEERSLTFLQVSCKLLEAQSAPNNPLMAALEAGKVQIFAGQWPNHLTAAVKEDFFTGMLRMKNKAEVKTSVFYLLKAIRNKVVKNPFKLYLI